MASLRWACSRPPSAHGTYAIATAPAPLTSQWVSELPLIPPVTRNWDGSGGTTIGVWRPSAEHFLPEQQQRFRILKLRLPVRSSRRCTGDGADCDGNGATTISVVGNPTVQCIRATSGKALGLAPGGSSRLRPSAILSPSAQQAQ